MARKATLLGASGLIGGQLLELLLADPYFDEVCVMVRRSLNRPDPRLKEILTDFTDPDAYEAAIGGSETVFCAIGTTMKKVKGDHDAYRKVDYDIPVQAAQTAARLGVYGFVLVSSVGADASNNNNFYLKLKGVVEEAVCRERIPLVQVFRPSLLLGARKESRIGEGFAQLLAPGLGLLLRGRWSRFKPVKALDVARAMLAASKQQAGGIFIYHYDDFIKIIKDQYPG